MKLVPLFDKVVLKQSDAVVSSATNCFNTTLSNNGTNFI